MNQVVSKPILFNTEMVRSIQRGIKTQTRRVVKLKKSIQNPVIGFSTFCSKGEFSVRGTHESDEFGESLFKLPHQTGDILWVRETFSANSELNRVIYRADVCSKWDLPDGMKWKPSIFMPKELCRLFLQITSVRIERLQDISENDCVNEGIRREVFPETGEPCYYFYPCDDLRDNSFLDCPKTSFYSLWRSINGQESWDSNPYVFVYEFELIDKPMGFLKH